MDRNSDIGQVADALEIALDGLQDAEHRPSGGVSEPGRLNHVFPVRGAGGMAAAGLFRIKALALCDDISDAW